MSNINFFYEETLFRLKKAKKIKAWLEGLAQDEKKELGALNYIFCSDTYLLEINKQYLGHDYLTDIISFQHNTSNEAIEGDIYISIDRVRDNAKALSLPFEHELNRVVIHGLLHFFGFKDKTAAQKALMRKKEDACLSLL